MGCHDDHSHAPVELEKHPVLAEESVHWMVVWSVTCGHQQLLLAPHSPSHIGQLSLLT